MSGEAPIRLLLCQDTVTVVLVWLTTKGWVGGPGRASGSDGARLKATFGLMGLSTSNVAVHELRVSLRLPAQQVYEPESSSCRLSICREPDDNTLRRESAASTFTAVPLRVQCTVAFSTWHCSNPGDRMGSVWFVGPIWNSTGTQKLGSETSRLTRAIMAPPSLIAAQNNGPVSLFSNSFTTNVPLVSTFQRLPFICCCFTPSRLQKMSGTGLPDAVQLSDTWLPVSTCRSEAGLLFHEGGTRTTNRTTAEAAPTAFSTSHWYWPPSESETRSIYPNAKRFYNY